MDGGPSGDRLPIPTTPISVWFGEEKREKEKK